MLLYLSISSEFLFSLQMSTESSLLKGKKGMREGEREKERERGRERERELQ